jgi:gamma-tubulin complex component 2
VAKSFALRAAKTYASAFALRQRMLNCVQNLEYYMMVEVIEPNWITFLASINKVNHITFDLKSSFTEKKMCVKVI